MRRRDMRRRDMRRRDMRRRDMRRRDMRRRDAEIVPYGCDGHAGLPPYRPHSARTIELPMVVNTRLRSMRI